MFGELTWHLNTDLDLTVGLRRFDNEISNDTEIELPIYPGASEVGATTETRLGFSVRMQACGVAQAGEHNAKNNKNR